MAACQSRQLLGVLGCDLFDGDVVLEVAVVLGPPIVDLHGQLEPVGDGLGGLLRATLRAADDALDRVTADIGSADGVVGLRATGQTVAFDGFLKLYQEGRDDPAGDEDEDGAVLPPLAVGDAMKQRSVTPLQHFTEPPPRYSEASLVKKME